MTQNELHTPACAHALCSRCLGLLRTKITSYSVKTLARNISSRQQATMFVSSLRARLLFPSARVDMTVEGWQVLQHLIAFNISFCANHLVQCLERDRKYSITNHPHLTTLSKSYEVWMIGVSVHPGLERKSFSSHTMQLIFVPSLEQEQAIRPDQNDSVDQYYNQDYQQNSYCIHNPIKKYKFLYYAYNSSSSPCIQILNNIHKSIYM